MIFAKGQQLFSLIACILMIAAVAINRDGQIGGHKLTTNRTTTTPPVSEQIANDGTLTIYTKELAKDIKGYGGNIPLKIRLREGVVIDIEALPNSESPKFFNQVKTELLPQWAGLTIEDALHAPIDGISGATLSSQATIKSIQNGLAYAKGINTPNARLQAPWFTLKFICTLGVILAGSMLPLFIRSRRYRMIQLFLNIIVLGFWSGSFLSYSLFVNYLSNGVNVWLSIIPILLLVIAFLYPLFGKKNHYCTWICPLGSLQELVGRSVKYKLPMHAKTIKYLNRFREYLWAFLMLLLWTGVWFQWMDYELFTVFLFRHASPIIIVSGIVFLLLSAIIQRPYCRFVCPTGTLFKVAQNTH